MKNKIIIHNKRCFYGLSFIFLIYSLIFLYHSTTSFPVLAGRTPVNPILVIGLTLVALLAIIYKVTKYVASTNEMNIGIKQIFYIFSIVNIIFFFILAYLSRGHSFTSIFISDQNDIFMDFFNSIHDSDHPYDRKVIYPPLINVFYMIIGRIFDFKMFSTLEIRDSRLGIMMQMLYHGILFIALYNRLISMRLNICNNVRENRIIYTIILFSLPMLFTIERGNSVFLCLLSLLYFVEYYKSDKKSNRYKSYIALAIAGSIKIIPFIFGALLFRTVRKKEIIHAGLICSVVFMAPFIVTHGGPIQMVKNIMFTTNLFQSGEVRDGIFKFMGYGAFVNISNIYQFIDRVFEVDISGIGAVINKVLLGITLLICSISTKITEFYKVTLLSLILLLFVGISAIYNLIYLFIPLILLINEYDYGKTSNINYLILFTFLGIIMTPIFNPPLDILSTFSEDIHPLTISTIVECLFVVMLYFYMLIKSILIIKNSI